MTPRQKLFLLSAAGIFFFIALADLYLHAWGQVYGWFGAMSWYGKMSTVCFALILLVLVIGQFNRKK